MDHECVNIWLHKNGDSMGMIITFQWPHGVYNVGDMEIIFQDRFIHLISEMVDKDIHKGDWEFQFDRWLRQYSEVINKLRNMPRLIKLDMFSSSCLSLTVGEIDGATEACIIDDKVHIYAIPPIDVENTHNVEKIKELTDLLKTRTEQVIHLQSILQNN